MTSGQVKQERLSITIRIVAALLALLMVPTGILGAYFVFTRGITSENAAFGVAACGAVLFGILLVYAALIGRSPSLRDWSQGGRHRE